MKVVFEHVPGREWFVVVGVTHEKNDTMNRLEIPEYPVPVLLCKN